jgi:pyridoxal phosphate enzyme (YggS family)
MVDIRANLQDVQRRIAEAAGRAGRDPTEITLVAVTKTFTVDHIQAAYGLGVCHFGENRVHEAQEKIPIVNQWVEEKHALWPITWHMVGHLQSRKAQNAIQLFDTIHSVDTLKLAERLDRLCQREGRVMPILLEANVSGEESKYGFALDRWAEDEEQRERFLAIVGGDTNPAPGGGAGLDDHGSHRG